MFTILGADGKEYGPVSAGKLHEWIAAGRANLQTKAKRAGDPEWMTLADFPEVSLLGTNSSSTPPMAAPATDTFSTVSAATVTATATLELAPATRRLRLGAFLLDSIIGGFLVLPGTAILLSAGAFNDDGPPNAALIIAGFGALALALLIFLGIQIYLLTVYGQTMGKKLLGIKIVNFDDEALPGFVRCVLLRFFVNLLFCFVPAIGLVYLLINISFIFRDDRRCLHDLLAGTKVVKK